MKRPSKTMFVIPICLSFLSSSNRPADCDSMMFRIVDGAAAEEKEERDEGSTQRKRTLLPGVAVTILFVCPATLVTSTFLQAWSRICVPRPRLASPPFNLVLLTPIVLLIVLPLRIKRSTTGWRKMHENDGYTECECFHLHFQGL